VSAQFGCAGRWDVLVRLGGLVGPLPREAGAVVVVFDEVAVGRARGAV